MRGMEKGLAEEQREVVVKTVPLAVKNNRLRRRKDLNSAYGQEVCRFCTKYGVVGLSLAGSPAYRSCRAASGLVQRVSS